MSTDGGITFTDIAGATSTTYSFTATSSQDGDEFRTVFTNAAGSATTNAATLTVQQATIASTVGVAWGTAGTATLQTNADGLRLLPAGRNTDLPWLGINKLTITLSSSRDALGRRRTVTGINVANYGPVTISGSGTNYTITLAQPINAADRVTVTIGNASIATFTRRLDVLPGDVNDDGMVNSQDAVLVRNEFLALRAGAYQRSSLDINGDGIVDINDTNLLGRFIGKKLPDQVSGLSRSRSEAPSCSRDKARMDDLSTGFSPPPARVPGTPRECPRTGDRTRRRMLDRAPVPGRPGDRGTDPRGRPGLKRLVRHPDHQHGRELRRRERHGRADPQRVERRVVYGRLHRDGRRRTSTARLGDDRRLDVHLQHLPGHHARGVRLPALSGRHDDRAPATPSAL